MTKYEEFLQTKEVLENLEPYIISDFDLDRVFQKYKKLLGEVLEQYKLLEDNLEWRKRTEPCLNLVQKILKNTPESEVELFQLLLDFKCKVEEGIGEKE